ncbi:MAG: hypothetical protein AAGK25_11060 [Pseudomonadota bacterium]
MIGNISLIAPPLPQNSTTGLADPYTLLMRNHADRLATWRGLCADGGMAQIDLVGNHAVYDRFIDPELALIIGRRVQPWEITFLQVIPSLRLAIVHERFLLEVMEAAHG